MPGQVTQHRALAQMCPTWGLGSELLSLSQQLYAIWLSCCLVAA